jgi:uracil-DNA glycosylase
LLNIIKEIEFEYGKKIGQDLSVWAEEGVLLLNTVLTVGDKAQSHSDIGWQHFTNSVFDAVIKINPKVVFLAFGNLARDSLKNKQATTIHVGHPSPLNTLYPFYKSGIFKKSNEALMKMKLLPIRWVK